LKYRWSTGLVYIKESFFVNEENYIIRGSDRVAALIRQMFYINANRRIVMVYVALLRGINVGGKNKIDMKLLKKTFERVGMSSVVTYINSGNIIFTVNGQSKTTISHILEEAIHTDFELQIKVLVHSFDDFKKVIHSLPESWKNDQQMRSDVLFLWDEIDDESVLSKLVIKPEIDTVKYVPGAILWSVEKKTLPNLV
jgi:uncharacterized protein (DUF1697 family)